jgi:thiol-disulfide isomerase/thioredoxin
MMVMNARIGAAMVLSISAVLLSTRPAASGPIARVGAPAPEFRIDALDGTKIDFAQYHGRPVMLNFFATWCPPCKLELPYIVRSYPAYASRVAYLGIDEQESPKAVEAFARKEGMTYRLGIDQGNVAAQFAVGAIPVSVFVDAGGIVRAINRGYLTPTLLRQDLGLIAGH